ncbi:FAD-dependent oxidoreductase [Paenibacillus mendelii]|uniref:FAD-dependent oxidoreductase n=1 Tax=Paenibacillus mendelii TaxID=206163 RepID=A0ABV6J6I8_9BACL|nr:FAD-dependent oxidoreductase [Paenibacillus mendelii]MCQ6561131.1 FAD-dependent oxidoreductase [Paenibacillus mendelii]
MRQEVVQSAITVIGGGLAGVCAAVAAARAGQTVSLVQNRPMLGGNSSSEVRVWVCGATSHGVNSFARETGIMGEMFVENQYRNPEGNPYYWDLVVLETVRAEKNITLFLNTDVHEVEADGEEASRRIRSVTGWMMGSERRIRFESQMYLDCTGDGLVGFLAGARYRIGREARDEYKEEWAPVIADDITLGSTMLFYTKDVGRPVKYVPPGFAINIAETSIPINRVIRSGDNGCAYWWIEWGGEIDTVHDNERIRDELWSVIYGIWDYIKNSGQFEAENMTLEWVGSVPGKREYRRFIGDYVLNQNDIMEQREFEDRVAFGGWSIDLHPPQGVYSTEHGSKHMHADGIYYIPFRSLYSVNVSNMMMAGRNISASHVAFGTTRVMATCAVIGEAAGLGAALSAEKGIPPRELYRNHMAELQQRLLLHDASVIGLHNKDADDLALRAEVTASTTLTSLAVEQPVEAFPLTKNVGLLLPADPGIHGLELLIDAADAALLEVELWDTRLGQNYVPHAKRSSAAAQVDKGEKQWVKLDLSWIPDTARNAFIIIKANDKLAVHLSDRPHTGTLAFLNIWTEEQQPGQLAMQWSMRPFARKAICFRLLSPTEAFSSSKVIDGYNRPYAGPHLWSSRAMQDGVDEWLELSWPEPVQVGTVHLTFNDDVNEDLINLHHHRTPFEVIPELVRHYVVQAELDGVWETVAEQPENRKRRQEHIMAAPIVTNRLRIVIKSMNGAAYAEVVEMRVYAQRPIR